MLTIIQRWTLVILVLICSGCGFLSWTRVTINRPLTADDAAFIMAGKTSFIDVLTRLGAPDEMLLAEDGGVARYYYRDVKYFRANYGWPLQFISAVSFIPHDLVAAGGGLGTDVFQIGFDADGVVKYYAFAHHTEKTRYKPWPFGAAQ